MSDSAAAPSFLYGISVLDLSIWRPGPYAASLLVYLGADVIKVEPPGGDPMRHYRELFNAVNAGKRSIMLDLKEPSDRARALDLAERADVVLEGFRPGVMARLGLDEPAVRARNPGIIYCSISGYGQEGPLSQLPGHDVNYQAWSGALAPEGGTAAMPPLPVADLASGMTAAFGICAALAGRQPGGPGAYLDISMTDVMATWTGDASPADGSGPEPEPTPGYGLFTTADGCQVALGVVNEQHFWDALCGELGLDDYRGLPFAVRTRRGAELAGVVTAAVAGRQRDELVAALLRAGVPAAPVRDRSAMVAAALPVSPLPFATFPPFPIRLPTQATAPVPGLDQHRGQGFH